MKGIVFIIVTFNSENEIGACLKSITGEGVPGTRIVVVDNASQDGTIKAIHQSGIEALLIKNESNRGFAAACNQGAEASSEENIMLLNPDARLISSAAEELRSAIEADERIGIAGPRLMDSRGETLPSAYRLPTVFQELAHLFRLKRALTSYPMKMLFGKLLAKRFAQYSPHDRREVVQSVLGACMMVKREVWEALGGLVEDFFLFYEEKDFCKRAAEAGYSTLFVPEAEACHDIGGSVRSDPAAAQRAKRTSMLLYYRKHKSLAARLVVQAALLLTAAFSARPRSD